MISVKLIFAPFEELNTAITSYKNLLKKMLSLVIIMENININSAIKSYIRQRNAIKRWNERNPDKQKGYSKTNYDKMKNSDPDKYQKMLQRKKENYMKKKLAKSENLKK